MFDFHIIGSGGLGRLSSRPSTPSHLHSRTLKRFRDNRPSEAEIHRKRCPPCLPFQLANIICIERTLSILFSAQQQQRNSSSGAQSQSDTTLAESPRPQAQIRREAHQRSLHSFWGLTVSTSSAATPMTVPAPPPTMEGQSVLTICEDCDARASDRTEMMDVDDFGSCGACGKTICSRCSISNLGDNRRCLVCAEQRRSTVDRTHVYAC